LNTSRLALEQEMRAIQQKIRAADFRDFLTLVYTPAAQPDDLLQALNEHKPHIVHFSSHGRSTGEILLLDSSGKKAEPVSPEALKSLFTELQGDIRLVFFNACYSRIQGDAITSVIDCAIAMDNRMSDEAAIIFAAAVYQAIAFGHSLKRSFKLGQTALQLHNSPEYTIPQLLYRSGIDPAQIHLISSKEKRFAGVLTQAVAYIFPAIAPLTLFSKHRFPMEPRKNVFTIGSALLALLFMCSLVWAFASTVSTNNMHVSATATAQVSLIAASETAVAACAAAPSLIEPIDGQTLSSRTVRLSWEAPQDCIPDGYTVRINPDYDPEAKPWIVDAGWGPTAYTYTFMADGTYYWHIRACKPCSPFQPGHWVTRSFTIHTSSAH
jgi:hypothetical protein